MSQSMKGSIAETIFSTIVGFGINYSANVILLPHLWDKDHVASAAFTIGVFFTVISVARGFGIRRLFNYPPFSAWIDRMNNHLEIPAAWLTTRLASATNRVRSAVRKTTSRATTTATPTASAITATTSSERPPTATPPEPGVLPGEAARTWTS